MGRVAHRAVRRVLAATLRGDEVELDAVHRLDRDVDELHGHIIHYLGQVSERVTLAERMDEVQRLMDAANALEHIGDIVETNLIAQGRQRLAAGLEPSQTTVEMLAGLHRLVTDAVETAVRALRREDEALAREVMATKPRIDEMAEQLAEHQRQRLLADAPARVETYRLETDVAENLKRIDYFARRIARSVSSDDQSEA
jgi:phosphate:Na+ symporter